MKCESGFAVWITGLPASGKSTITRKLVEMLGLRGVDVAVLESDVVREAIAGHLGYSDSERDSFYNALVWIGELLTRHGVPVIFDATANRQSYRARARERIAKYLEVHVDCPVSVCMERDPKGIYRRARVRETGTVPGIQSLYEIPADPDLVVSGNTEDPEQAAGRILEKIAERGYVPK